MITLTIVATIFIVLIVIIVAVHRFISYAKKLFNDGSISQTDTDPHTYIDARKLPRSSKK